MVKKLKYIFLLVLITCTNTTVANFMSEENEKYKRVLPPLSLLSEKERKELMNKLKELEFFPEKNIAA